MDHHCPWVNNCVGHYNYAYFVKMLVFFWAGCLFVVAVSFRLFLDTLPSRERSTAAEADPFLQGLTAPQRTRIGLAFAICLSIGIAVGVLLAWHLYLILSAQTSIEFSANKSERNKWKHRGRVFRNPYDLGPAANWALVFGTASPVWWLLPRLKDNGCGDGWSFATVDRPLPLSSMAVTTVR
jgi:palmitoyltransferase